eukprot:TRINITY_DN4327_c0_g1_i1.p1 TRINITY_DN4327_c0_g1~~TRINITY_DN4327_c0_g1_i1.p1  ORF type:complete len:568 (-),score=157.78 TRINITY_DN4327_c0_g1_i1:28-1707(-)
MASQSQSQAAAAEAAAQSPPAVKEGEEPAAAAASPVGSVVSTNTTTTSTTVVFPDEESDTTVTTTVTTTTTKVVNNNGGSATTTTAGTCLGISVNPLLRLFVHNPKTGATRTPNEEEMEKLTQLDTLDLSSCNIASLARENFAHTTVLAKLLLTNNSLSTLHPDVVASCAQTLTVLHLSFNKIAYLPPFLHLQNLRQLFLSNNQLTEFPAELPVTLERLDLSWNKLRVVPAHIKNLVNLEKLNLWNNCIDTLTPEIMNLTKLKTLWVDCNRLITIPHEISHLTNLHDLHAADNPFCSIAVKEALAKRDIQLIFQNLETEYKKTCKRLDIVKVIFVGEAGVGKTTAFLSIVDPKTAKITKRPRADLPADGAGGSGASRPSTRGTSRQSTSRGTARPASNARRTFEQPAYEETCGLNSGTFVMKGKFRLTAVVWDIGGWVAYKPVQQFFLQESHVVYVLVYNMMDADNGNQEGWLQLLTATSPKAPVILLPLYMSNNPRVNERVIARQSEVANKEYTPVFTQIDGIVPIAINAATMRLEKPEDLKKAIHQVRLTATCFAKN